MGSVLSSAYAALCAFVKSELRKAEVRRLMDCYPDLSDLPAEEREDQLRWLMEEEEKDEHPHPEVHARLRERDAEMRCRYRHPSFRVDDKATRGAENL